MVMDSLDDCSPLERFINVHTGHETQNGGEDMKLFTKIFGSTRKQVAGDSNVVSVLLQSISVGADPKIQVGKIRTIVGDSDETFNGFLSELEMAGDEKPEVVAKAVDIVDNYYKEHLAGDEKPEPEEKKTEDRLIKGCQSRVWLDYRVENGRIDFSADSDAIITKGIISLLISVYSGRSAEEIAGDDFSFLDRIGLKENLSPTRANGLVSMIDTIKAAAIANCHKQ